MKTIKISALVFAITCMLISCSKSNLMLNQVSDPNAIDPEKLMDSTHFIEGVTNKYMPLTPGDTFFYQNVVVDNEDTTIENIYVTTTNDIKKILGVNCTIVHDVVSMHDTITEDTYDWYAQDKLGNVWYFGEDTKSLQEDGSWSTEGSFEAGVDGARAGIVMTAHPDAHIGRSYRQEYYPGHAEDQAKVLNTNSTVAIDLGTFTQCVETAEFTILEPDVVENKWYAPGIGQILTVVSVGGNEREELLNITHQ